MGKNKDRKNVSVERVESLKRTGISNLQQKYKKYAVIVSKDNSKTIVNELIYPENFDNRKYVGRVFMSEVKFNIFWHAIDPANTPGIFFFEERYLYDTTWKFRIEPYELNNTTKDIMINDQKVGEYKILINNPDNKIQHVFDFFKQDKNQYIVLTTEVKLLPIYPFLNNMNDIQITYS